MNLIKTYLPEGELIETGAGIMQKLAELELTWLERAEHRGELTGKRELLLHLLALKIGRLPSDFIVQLNAITDHDALDRLSEQVLTAESLADISLPSV